MRFTGAAGKARLLDLSQGSPGVYIPSSREDIAFLIGHSFLPQASVSRRD